MKQYFKLGIIVQTNNLRMPQDCNIKANIKPNTKENISVLPEAIVRTHLHSESHWDKLSAANTCSMEVRVSWMSFMRRLSVSVSSMEKRTPGNPDSVIINPKTMDFTD